ncbi:MAG TPA: hypothetical protein VJL58_06155 [Pyrinomonadaceae bacterium]|nr:hypothetical protein [Pyrinomonadaceae bacterium]
MSEASRTGSRSRLGTVTIAALILMTGILLSGLGGYLYWLGYEDTPQYSLALLIDAARRDDQAAINDLVDVDAVVDDFVPQITSKAAEMYGRGLSPKQVEGLSKIAKPILPAVKNRVRSELPRQIRNKTNRFGSVPFTAMVLGAEQYLDINVAGDSAKVKSKLPEHSFEVQMKRNGDRWVITGLRDDQLSTDIARAVGEEIIAVASNGTSVNKIGVRNITELLQAAEEILK